MRHDSERVKGKNYRPLGGRPLYHHIVSSLLACPQLDEVIIDTDSSLITEEAKFTFPEVRVLPRPEHLLGGEVPMNDVLLNDIEQVQAAAFQVHPYRIPTIGWPADIQSYGVSTVTESPS